MNKSLICLEGTLRFEEEIRTQSINIVSFREGQQINISRDRLLPGHTFSSHMSLQIDNAQKVFNKFGFIKMQKLDKNDSFVDTIQIVFTFVTAIGEKLWQVTFASCLNGEDILNFTSVYPDEQSMKKEIVRLQHCAKHFTLSSK